VRGARLALAAVGLAFVLALVGGATGAAPSPSGQLVVLTYRTASGQGGFGISIRSADNAPAPARVTVYVANGYAVDLTRPPGQAIGQTFGVFSVEGGDPEFAEGLVKVGDPATLPADAAAQACAPGTHAAVWVASYKIDGQALSVRFYVDPTSGSESAFGAYKLVACFASPYVPPSAGGAGAGERVLDFEIGLEGAGGAIVTQPASGTYVWRMLVTPYVAGTATSDDATTFEARTRVLKPHALVDRVRYLRRAHEVVVSGSLRALGTPRPRRWVNVVAGPRNGELSWWGEVRTRANGTFAFRKRVQQGPRARTVEVWIFAEEDFAACSSPSVAPAGCVDESLSPPTALMKRVTIPGRAKKR
jgi:hypothetical protein